MIIHFICRGNSFRSIIAEAYLNSLGIQDASVLSSGTTAALDKARNLAYYRMTLELLGTHGIRGYAKVGYGDQLTQPRIETADITVCMNQRVYDECLRCVTFPASPRIWAVADIGEPGRISDVESERELYREEAYQEIVSNVDRLISDIGGMPNSRSISDRTSYEPRHGKDPTGRHIDLKPGHTGRQAVREPAHRAPPTLRTAPQRIQKQLVPGVPCEDVMRG